MLLHRRHAKVWVIIGLTLIALFIRLWGVGFGLPYEYHIDEHFYYPYAWAMGQGRFNLPDQSHGPSLYLGLLLIAQQTAHVMARPDLTSAQFGELITSDPSLALLAGRLVSALAGALTVPIVFLLARRYRDERTGLLAAAIMTVVFFHVRDSHFGVPDAVMVLFTTLTIWLALRAFDTHRPLDFLLAGFFAGQTAAAKYTSALIFVPVILAIFATRRRLLASGLWLLMAGLGFIVGFVSGYPNILLNFSAFVKDISFLWIRVGGGFEGWRIVPDDSGWFYLFTLTWSIGWPMMILSAVGVLDVAARRYAKGWLLISFPIIYCAAMSASRGHFGRYMLPVLPFLAVLTADTGWRVLPQVLGALQRRLTDSKRRMPSASAPHLSTLVFRPASLGIIALLGVIVPNAIDSLRADWIMSQPDTRTQAKQWIEANVPVGTRIAIEWPYHTPPLSNGYEVPPNSQREYWIDRVWGFGLADRLIEQYRTDGTQLLVATSYIRDIPVDDRAQEDNRRRFYAQLPQVFTEIARFSPRCDDGEPNFIFDQIYGPAIDLWQTCYAGPLISIYQVH
ncbi:MAG: glycosyltransferase family 39 protein [Anaerolineae bacterium]